MTILGGLIHNASLLLALVLAYSLFIEHLPREHPLTQLVQGVLFGLAALIGMAYPVVLEPGVFFDARTVVISLAGVFAGAIPTLIATAIAAAFRAWSGGAGAMVGIATILTAAILGLSFGALRRAKRLSANALTLGALGVGIHLASMAWFLVLPAPVRAEVLSQIALPYLTVLPAVTLLLGLLLQMQEQRLANIQELRRNQDRLVEAQRIAGVGDWSWDLRTGQQDWSPQLFKLYGRNPAFPARPFPALFELYSDETWHSLAAAIETTCLDRQRFACNAEVIRPDASCRWVSVQGEAVHDDDGQAVLLRGTVKDVTEQEELHQRIEKLAARVPGMLYQYQQWPDGRSAFPYASGGLVAIYGIEPEQVKTDATPVFELIHPDDIERIKDSVTRSMERMTTWHERYRVLFPDGRSIWAEGEASPARQADGSVLWHGYIRDITEQERAEAQLKLAASVFAHSRDGILITDADNRIIDVNPSFTRITGYRKTQVLGHDPGLLSSERHDDAFYSAMWHALHHDGFWQGEIWNRRKGGEMFPELLSISVVRNNDGAVRHYIGVFSDIGQAKAHQAQLDHIAHHDHLTGLPNRRLLTDRLEQALARGRRTDGITAVCYLDLDGFKSINDRHGHAAGDQFLNDIASALQGILRDQDTIARLGGDEFVLLLTDLIRPDDCTIFLNRILAKIRETNLAQDDAQPISASIGVTVCPPDCTDPDTLLRHADQAMFRAKESGKNSYHLYDSEQDRVMQSRRSQREELRRALGNQELVLWFQPEVDLVSRAVMRVEALIRWQHPEQGLLPPAAFLPSIEGTGLEIAVGEWVIDTAIRQQLDWLQHGLPMPVSINIGGDHLLRPDFFDRLLQRFAGHPGSRIKDFELEVLETSALSDFKQALRVVSDCKAAGLQIALDDFGTGYSSLSYLRQLPVDRIKIDQSFVRNMLKNPGDMEIVESVIRLAKSFDRSVIAEGVETLDHAALLTWLGCRHGQGYGIARPMPAADLPAWVEHWYAQTGWPEVEPDGAGLHPELPVLVAAQNHRYWLHHVSEAVAQTDRARVDEFDAAFAQFSSWYRGQGEECFGTLSEFQAARLAQSNLHRAADALTSSLRTGVDQRSLSDPLHEVQTASKELLHALRHLVERICPVAPD